MVSNSSLSYRNYSGMILANETRCYNLLPPLIDLAHTQNVFIFIISFSHTLGKHILFIKRMHIAPTLNNVSHFQGSVWIWPVADTKSEPLYFIQCRWPYCIQLTYDKVLLWKNQNNPTSGVTQNWNEIYCKHVRARSTAITTSIWPIIKFMIFIRFIVFHIMESQSEINIFFISKSSLIPHKL